MNKCLWCGCRLYGGASQHSESCWLNPKHLMALIGQKSEVDMSRKQRTPEEIEAEMNEQEEEETEEETEEEEEEEEESSPKAASDTLIENYGAFLCMGYSPAQVDKHLPKLVADVATIRKVQVAAMVGN